MIQHSHYITLLYVQAMYQIYVYIYIYIVHHSLLLSVPQVTMSGTNQTITEPIAKMVSKRDLFQNVMKNDWNKILTICEEQPEAHKEKITRTGDTLLHLAVADRKDEIVQQLVGLIKMANKREALGIVNERKNTPLHLAASLGNVQMCRWIASEYPEGIGARNVDGETPFFLAATHGMLDAFLCLHFIIPPENGNKQGLSYARRNNGENVLHSAIHGDYFGEQLIAFTR